MVGSAPTPTTLWLAVRFVLAVLTSGLLLSLALPPSNVAEVGWICWLPVFLAVKGRGVAFGFAGGIFSCLVAAFVCDKGWFYATKLYEASNGWTYTGCAIFGLAAAITGAAIGSSKELGAWRCWAIASLAVLAEALLLFYLPAHLALTQNQNFPVLLLTQVGGVWTASLLVWFVNVFLTDAVEQGAWKLVAAVGGVAILSAFGSRWVSAAEGKIPIAVIQTTAGDPETLSNLNRLAGERGAIIAVWPELAGTSMAAGGKPGRLVEIAQESGQIPFITSYPDGSSPKPFNTAQIFSGDWQSDPYRKRKPFAAESQMHQAGTEPVVVDFEGVRYGLGICFDSCFPNVMHDLVRHNPGANIILLPTLDPETPHGFAAAVHASYSSFRAAEMGTPIIRADIAGWSHAVDGNGMLVGQLKLEQDAVAVYRVTPGSGSPRIAARLGNGVLLLPVAIIIADFVRRRRRPADEVLLG